MNISSTRNISIKPSRFDQAIELLPDTSGQFPWVSRVAVVGAGIAGSAVARALCQAGIRVDLFDQASGPASGASGNWVGAFHPHITRGDAPLSKLTRLGFQHTVQAFRELSAEGLLTEGRDWATPGHLQVFPPDQAERAKETLRVLNFPSTLVQWAEPFSHLPTPHAGYFFPQAGWVKPPSWVQANLQACGSLLRTHWNASVQDLSALLSQFDAVVLACAQHSLDLAPIVGAITGTVKGQITRVHLPTPAPGEAKPLRLPVVLSGESYAISPPVDDWLLLGATYERPALDLEPTAAADESNVSRFKAVLPDWPLGAVKDQRCGVRFVWNDRLPAIGPHPTLPRVFLSTGFASRGLLWAALGGWVLAQYCKGLVPYSPLLEKIKPRCVGCQGL
jgi:tRNA 5-methylaminomethyl-2-thiouridine biosynthesis bifunctional protein